MNERGLDGILSNSVTLGADASIAARNPATPAPIMRRVRSGKRQTTDGPFAETREQLGGYYLVDAKDLDDAIGIAERIPGARTGSIEVRPIMQTSM